MSNEIAFKDKVAYEKALASLEYLEFIVKQGFDPLFKGGTCAQLFIPKQFQRLSLDIDIALSHPADLEEIIAASEGAGYACKRWRDFPDPNLPFVRYSISSKKAKEFYFDIILKEPAVRTQKTLLETAYFASELMVRTPTLPSLLGDKLTTLGPHTVGRQLNEDRGATEHIKQVYDISQLLNLPFDQKEVFTAYKSVVDDQKSFRPDRKITYENAAEDLHYIARLLTITAQDPKLLPREQAMHLSLLKNGIDGIGAYLQPKVRFGPNEVREAGGLIALMSKVLHSELSMKEIKDFRSLKQEGEKTRTFEYIENAMALLTEKEPAIEWKRLKGLTPRSILYWYFAYFGGS